MKDSFPFFLILNFYSFINIIQLFTASPITSHLTKLSTRFLLQPKYVLDALRQVEEELKQNPDAADRCKKFIYMECHSGASSQKTKKFLNR
jgi:hypothetical protein